MWAKDVQREALEWVGFALLIAIGITLAVVAIMQRPPPPPFEELTEVTVGLTSPPATLDIEHMGSPEDWEVLSEIHLSLVSLDSSGHIYPQVASRWTVRDEGRRYVFHLRDDLSFASGRALECIHVLRTFQRLTAATLPLNALIASLDCDGAREFVIRLKQPSALFLTQLSDLRYAVRSLESVNGGGKPDFDGLGPYAIDHEALASGAIRLRRRHGHPLANTYSPAVIRFQVVRSQAEAERLLRTGGLHLYPTQTASTHGVGTMIYSHRRDRVWLLVLAPKLMREDPLLAACLNEKLNRKALVNNLGDASMVATNSLAPLSETSSNSASVELLDQPDCRNLSHGHLELLAPSSSLSRVGNELKLALSRLGLAVVTRAADPHEAFETALRDENFDLALLSEGVTDSPYADLTYFFRHSPTFPPSRWVDPVSARLAERLEFAHNEVEARDLALTLTARTLKIGPYVPLFYENEHYLASRCLRVTEPDRFGIEQPFASLARERRCRD